MNRTLPLARSLGALALGLLAAGAQARQDFRSDPRTSIRNLAGSSSALHVVTEPGSYYLDRNLLGESGRHGILVEADDVTIALEGFRLVGVAGSLSAISDGSAPRENIAVLGGDVVGWGQAGLSLASSQFGIVQGLTASGNQVGLDLGENFLVQDCTVSESVGNGIQLDPGCAVLDSRVRGSGSTSISTLGAVSGQLLLADTVLQTSSVLPGANSLVTRCTIESTSNQNGHIVLNLSQSTLVSDCQIRNSSVNQIGTGIFSGNRNLILRNHLQGLGFGVSVGSSQSWVTENVAGDCWFGIGTSSSGSLITNNQAIDCLVPFNLTAGNSFGALLAPATPYFSDLSPWANISH